MWTSSAKTITQNGKKTSTVWFPDIIEFCPCLDICFNVNFGNSSYSKVAGEKYTLLIWENAIGQKIESIPPLTVLIVSLFVITLLQNQPHLHPTFLGFFVPKVLSKKLLRNCRGDKELGHNLGREDLRVSLAGNVDISFLYHPLQGSVNLSTSGLDVSGILKINLTCLLTLNGGKHVCKRQRTS